MTDNANRHCPLCKEVFLPHETALFYSGRCNLAKIYLSDGYVLVHHECAEQYPTTSELVKALTEGKEDFSHME